MVARGSRWWKSPRALRGDGDVQCRDCDGGYLTVYSRQNQLNCMLKINPLQRKESITEGNLCGSVPEMVSTLKLNIFLPVQAQTEIHTLFSKPS